MPRPDASAGADPYRGRKIGKYEILTRLSVGGMAELFLAFTSGPGGFRKFVALKQILPDVKTDEFVKMFLDEARITAAFSHPNIGQVFDLGLEDDELYLAMEFLPGQNLEQVMVAASYTRPLPVGFAARVARDVCLGLHYAHHFTAPSGRKVAAVHRDMAPRNVMITYDGVVKVIDFGIAKARGRIARTHVGMVKGTSGYMSPEQVRGQELDGRSDLFTAGVLLHEMLCGQRLFNTTDEDAMMRQIANADVAPPRDLNPDVPEALDAVVVRALEKDPARRFATGREMAKAIETAMGLQLFDEEAVAELMQALFAEKRLKTLALLDYASHDDERVSKVVEALRDDEKTLGGGSPRADEISDLVPTAPVKALSHQNPPSRPAAGRPAALSGRSQARKSGTGGDPPSGPARARPFPAPARSPPEAQSRKASLFEEDAPTQIGPIPGMPSEAETTLPPASDPREGRRNPRMGVFTLGPTESPSGSASRSRHDDGEFSETSEVSRVSRVSRALMALQKPSRRGLWIVGAIVLVGLAVLFMPEALRDRMGSVFSSAGQWASERFSHSDPQAVPGPPESPAVLTPTPAPPSQEAYEPPPPAQGSGAEDAVGDPANTPAAPAETVRPKKQGPSAASIQNAPPRKPVRAVAKPAVDDTAAEPSEADAEPTEADPAAEEETVPEPQTKPARTPVIQGKPAGRAAKAPAEEAPEPPEPHVGPAEVDPSIQPLEESPPTDEEAPQ
ncbi:serine/threonine-protein kinase [Hyalangium versicolor]|uniref:serine/threonine-protein kinase n=1 Tax=Hyalangium versicolor TaxID=2861190 RepID=UPI001CCB24F3|nr:serine/threonine-protein kinase [Hyalangium versicolor]